MLHDLQTRIAAAVIGGDGAKAAAFIVDDAPGAAARLAIYANHYRVTLIDALASTFPVVRRLVGADFFAAAARAFIREAPPAGPCLFEYGANFPAFLARLPAASPLPWLGDVAKLEWAVNVAGHALDVDPIDADALRRVAASAGAAAVGLHPSCRLVVSPFPVDRIWRAHEAASDEAIEPIDLAIGGVILLVHRRGDDVGWLRLSEGGGAFVAALAAGHGLEQALSSALGVNAAFSPAPLLADLLTAGLLVRSPS